MRGKDGRQKQVSVSLFGRILLGVLACLALAGGSARAEVAADRHACTNISFHPLEITVPACSRLIEGGLGGAEFFVALRRRADAYHYGAYLRGSGTPAAPAEILERALADLDRAAALHTAGSDVQHPPFWLAGPVDFARGEVLLQLGRFAAAADAYNRVVEATAGDLPSARFGRALALRQLGRIEAALADMDALVAQAPKTVNWVFLRGQMLEDLGRRDAAIVDYRTVLDLAPDHAAARLGLERLDAAAKAN